MIKAGLGAAGAILFVASPAFAAVNVANQDVKSHTIVINRGTKGETHQDIAAGKSATVDCPDKCGFRVATSGYSRLAGGNSKLVIDKDGELHFVGGHGDMKMPNGTD